jgi:hypothetical protein
LVVKGSKKERGEKHFVGEGKLYITKKGRAVKKKRVLLFIYLSE